MQETYRGDRTGIEADVTETSAPDGTYAIEITFSEDFDGSLYPGVAGTEMQELAEELYTEEDHFEALYVSDGEAVLLFPDDDPEKAAQVVEGVVENVDRYFAQLGDAPLEEYLAELDMDGI